MYIVVKSIKALAKEYEKRITKEAIDGINRLVEQKLKEIMATTKNKTLTEQDVI